MTISFDQHLALLICTLGRSPPRRESLFKRCCGPRPTLTTITRLWATRPQSAAYAATLAGLTGLRTGSACHLLMTMQVVFTTRSFDDAPDGAFPINFSGFTDMVHEGDTIFLGRYLVTGADESSLFLTVRPQLGILARVKKAHNLFSQIK